VYQVGKQYNDHFFLLRILFKRIQWCDHAIRRLGICGLNDGQEVLKQELMDYQGRECYCGAYLSSLSEKLNDTAKCVYACNGNSSQICGGALALTLYNLTSESKTGIAWSLIGGQPAWYGTAAVAMLIVAAVI
jgi:hypothetical protein